MSKPAVHDSTPQNVTPLQRRTDTAPGPGAASAAPGRWGGRPSQEIHHVHIEPSFLSAAISIIAWAGVICWLLGGIHYGLIPFAERIFALLGI